MNLLKIKNYKLKIVLALSFFLLLAISTAQVSAYLGGKSGAPVTSSGHAMRQPAAVTNGLVGWWKMDEKTGTTIADSSGNGNNGTATNGPTLNQEGKFNKAVSFDGVNDYVDFNTALTNRTADVSLSTWVNIPSISDRGAFIKVGGTLNDQHNNDANSGYSLGVGNGNFEIYGNSLIGLYEGRRWITPAINIGIGWHMVSMIIDSSGYPIFYLDGVQKTSAISGLTPLEPQNNTYIGGYQYGANSRYFKGSLDDVRVYNRALSAGEIQQLYAGSKPTNCDQTCVGWWKMDENAANTTVADSSGMGNTGTAVRNTNLFSTSGVFSGGLNFNGTSDYVSIPDNSSLNFSTNITATGWIKRSSTVSWWKMIYDSGTTGWAIMLQNNKLNFSKMGVLDVMGNTTLSQNVWYHFAIVKNGDIGNNILFYLNGNSDGTQSVGSVNTPSGTKYIGMENGSTSELPASLDDVRIYNRALSASEVNELYLSGRP